jgi:hypothetical protein
MHKILALIISFALISCSGNREVISEVSKLIKPSFDKNVSIYSCKLNPSSSLIDLEAFLSNNSITEPINTQFKTSTSLLFPDNLDVVEEFLIQLSAESSENILNSYAVLKKQGIEDIAACKIFNRPSYSSVLFDGFKKLNSSEYLVTEILSCSYNRGFNFGTFAIAIDRLIQKMGLAAAEYKISYLEPTESTGEEFIWFNSFSNNFYLNTLPDIWFSDLEQSREIQDEFKENATCTIAKTYKEFIIN